MFQGITYAHKHLIDHLAVLLTVAAKPSFNVPPLLFILEYTLVNAPTRARNAQSLSLTRPHLHVIEEFTLERGPISVLFKAVASPFVGKPLSLSIRSVITSYTLKIGLLHLKLTKMRKLTSLTTHSNQL